ncbi:MAG TPA: hypothetical protein VE869_13495 [Gemmatimonas sp.]|nr:hypothetical protein [Gemmatimonas sp.]
MPIIRTASQDTSTRSVRPEPTSLTTSLTRALLGACSLVMVTACSDREFSTSPDLAPRSAGIEAKGARNAIERFALAQGTFCSDDITVSPLACLGPFDDFGIGYIFGQSRAFGPLPIAGSHLFYIVDIGGVNPRYWERHGLSPNFPKYQIDGDVNETLLPDGRRHLQISARVKNTFTFIDFDTFNSANEFESTQRLFGSDFFQYPKVDPAIPDVTPVLANLTAELELVLPAGFVGYPDLIRIFDGSLPGLEARRMDITLESDARLQTSYNGWAAGTKVRVHVVDAFENMLTPTKPYVGPQITVTRIGGGLK